jgi:large subunit ribosomal protein L5
MAKQEKETKAKAERTPEQIEAEKAAKAAKKAEHAAAAKADRAKSGEAGKSRAKDAPPAQAIPFPKGYVPRLYKRYLEEIAPKLAAELGYKNRLQIPRITKVVINMGLGKAIAEKPRLEAAVKELTAIAGQKAVICQARKSVSNFKLRQGMEIGVKVTLRGQRMWEFLDRLIFLAIPRVKDFRGLNPKAFDGRGNYNLGLTEQTVFPEVHGDQVTFHQGLNITIVTTAVDNAAGFALLQHLGVPFARDQASEKSAARKAG